MAGVSGGSQNETSVRSERSMHGMMSTIEWKIGMRLMTMTNVRSGYGSGQHGYLRIVFLAGAVMRSHSLLGT